MSLDPKPKEFGGKRAKKRGPKTKQERIDSDISWALDTIIRNKEHFAGVWLSHDDWSPEKSDMAYLINKSIKRNK